MTEIFRHDGRHSFVLYLSKGKYYISNEYGTKPATKKQVSNILKELKP